MDEKAAKLCVAPECSILDAIKVLDETHERILLVVEKQRLLGVFTDSDVRKWILKTRDLTEKITAAMTKRPVCVRVDEKEQAAGLMERYGIDAIPVVDEEGFVQELLFRYETPEWENPKRETTQAPVVIMAGGKGTRLAPYTQVLPKPLIPIGNTTILEQVIASFQNAGCSRFYISVNYKKNLIKAYVQDLHPAYEVTYVEEEHFLGTAGSLSLLKDKIQEPFFVSNCDILLDVDYAKVMKFHKKNRNVITMITSLKNYTIPYGIVNIGDKGQVETLSEKPEMSFLVNTGVYVLEPEVLSLIPQDSFLHITELIELCIRQGKKVGAYPVTEKAWEDMGEFSSMEAMLRARGAEEE